MNATVALGLRAHRGGALVVGVALESAGPRLVRSTTLSTAAEGDRLAFEPYHVAFEMAQGAYEVPPKARDAVAEGRRRQEALAAEGLQDVARQLQGEGARLVIVALLVNRAAWMTDLLQYSLFDPSHPAVAEGLAVRDALRSAAGRCGLDLIEMDEKSLSEAGSIKLGLSPGELEARLKTLGASAKPWRKEHKLACLAAWLAATAR